MSCMLGNHASVRVPGEERDALRKFYGDVLGCIFTEMSDEKDVARMGNDFFIFLYGDFDDDRGYLLTGKSMWLELKADDVDAMRQRIMDFGVKTIELPDPHLYFQAPGGQVFRLVGTTEDLSKYEGNHVVATSSPAFWRTFDAS